MSTDTMRAPPLGSPLPADVARCPGYRADGELREGCDDCLRRTSPSPTDRVVWMAPPILVVLECESRIEPCPPRF